MKRLLVFFVFIPFLCQSQDTLQVSENHTIFMEKVIQSPDYSESQLYDISMDWVSKVFNSPKDVISFSDKSVTKIKGTFITDHPISLSNIPFSTTFTIQVKEGRLKILFNNIFNADQGYSLESYILKKNHSFRGMYSGLKNSVQSELAGLIINLETYIEEYTSTEDNW